MQKLDSLLRFLVRLEQKRCLQWEEELKNLPEGSLCIHFRGEKAYFLLRRNGTRTGITKDTELVYKLARKKYLQILIRERKSALFQACREAGAPRLSASSESSGAGSLVKLLRRYESAGLDILRVTCTEEQYQWAKAPYRRNMSYPEELKYETRAGVKVRSKSEQSIGNALEERGIPYRYEMEHTLEVGWMEGARGAREGRYKSYYPDFVIPAADNMKIIWEHLGRMDLEEYRVHNNEKIAAYREGGLCDEAHLILTFEKDMNNLETLGEIIERRIMPFI